MKWSITEGHRTTNPATTNITTTLGKRSPPIHRKSLAYPLLGDALATIRDSDTWWATRYCLLLLALTGLRSGEARKATWDEIDFETSIWKVPADRMKARIEHKVPLSTQAKEILHHAREQRGHHSQGLIFPSRRPGECIERPGKYMHSQRLAELLRESTPTDRAAWIQIQHQNLGSRRNKPPRTRRRNAFGPYPRPSRRDGVQRPPTSSGIASQQCRNGQIF